MRTVVGIVLTTLIGWGAEHYARFEPFERTVIKASVAGEVLLSRSDLEGRTVRDETVVHIDDRLDRLDLNRTRRTIALIGQTLELVRSSLPGLKASYQRQKRYFERLKGLSTASQNQKDAAFSAMVAAQNQWLGAKENALNLQRQLLDLRQKVALLQDRIAKKTLRLRDRYLYRLSVRKGEYVAPGTPLMTVDDLRRGKFVVYLSADELRDLSGKRIYIDGRPTDLKVDKVWKEADSTYISSYRAEIVAPPKYRFSSLHKVEFK